ncbi:unnamed protein product [Bubo scandiacus]
MASQPQPLRPTLPSAGGAGLAAGSPEKGTVRPKPPIRPKPRVLPKPAVPAKPSLPHAPPGPRHPRPELPSAEKMNRLAGPQPYGRGSVGGPLRRPSFTLKSPETPNGKGLSSPLVAATEDPGLPPGEEVPPAPPTPSRKGPAPFKVTPVPVATKPERFPGTTVEEILAKMDSREGPGSPDRARLSPFCPDPSSRFGSKTFTAFRRRPSGEADAAPPGETRQAPQPVAGELGVGDDGRPIAETSGSPPAGPSCAGDPRGRRRPPSPRDDLLGWSRKDLCSEFGIGHPPQAGAFDWTREAAPRERDWPGETERDREFGTKSTWDGAHGVREGDRQDRPFGTAGRDWGSDYEGTELTGETRLGRGDWPAPPSAGESCRQDRDFGAGKPKWGTSYGLGGAGREELGAGEADWSGGYSVGHGQRRDEGPGSGRPSWAGGYGTGDAQGKDGELSPDWASKYSSGDAEAKKDFTLGWAGRSSTGDTGSPEKDFSPSRAAWDSSYSPRDMESQDREFSPSRPAWDDGFSARDEPRDGEFSPSRPVWTGEYSARNMESQDREFSPSRPAWASDYHSRAMESQDREFSPVRAAEAGKYGTGDGESRDGEFSPSRVAWDDGYSTRDGETQEQEFSPSRAAWASEYSSTNAHKEDREFSPAQLSWARERGLGQTELADAFGVREEDLPGPRSPDTLAQEPSWGSTDRRERGATESRDWAGELGGAQRHNQFGTIGTERVPDPCSAVAAADGSAAWADVRRPSRDWPGDLSFGSPEATGWGPGLGNLPAMGNLGQAPEAGLGEPGWSAELCDAEAKRREWASAFGARCAARSRDCGDGERSPGGDGSSADGTIRLSAPSPPTGNAAELPRSEPPSPAEEERDTPEPAAAPPSPGASLLPPEAAGGTLPDTGIEGAPSEHPDGGTPPSWEEEQLSLDAPQPEGPVDGAGQEFTFLEDTEVLDSSVYRCKANLGRKRRHRAPALRRDAASEGDSWIFRDSTEPRPACPAASSDEETAEEPKSRRVRASPLGEGGEGGLAEHPMPPLTPLLCTQAKLRVRNRSAEEGAVPGDTKAAPPKDPHVQRSKSCKIPGSSGKPLVLPPKPEKSSGPDASPPHWLQALKLKKKKP